MLALATALVVVAMVVMAPGRAPAQIAAPPGQALAGSAIQAEQDGVISRTHAGPISVARQAVIALTSDVAADHRAVAADQAAQAAAEATRRAADGRLSSDQTASARAVTALGQADATLATDRARLRVIAIGMYTGALTNPQPASLDTLEANQDQVIDTAETELVAHEIDGNVHLDLATAAADRRTKESDAAQVVSDHRIAAGAAVAAVVAGQRTITDTSAVDADEGHLVQADRQLSAALAALTAALDALAGPGSTPPGQLSLRGGSALDVSQLVGWYQSEGYLDLTSATIQQLAAWYLQAGSREGVRGDVAFAQAVLETEGFSSPDAITFSNFAGIGHCDSCATGWAFSTPENGVVGQLELLRIFAGGGDGPYPPVLPELTTANQYEAGCCSTVESLTGIWATDPTYSAKILDIYGQMLSFALSSSLPT